MQAQCVACNIRCVIWADISRYASLKMYSERGRYIINIYIARLIIEHPREWLTSLADNHII